MKQKKSNASYIEKSQNKNKSVWNIVNKQTKNPLTVKQY